MVYYIAGVLYDEPTLHFWDKCQLIIVNNIFYLLLDLDCYYFVEDFFFLFIVIRDIDLVCFS